MRVADDLERLANRLGFRRKPPGERVELEGEPRKALRQRVVHLTGQPVALLQGRLALHLLANHRRLIEHRPAQQGDPAKGGDRDYQVSNYMAPETLCYQGVWFREGIVNVLHAQKGG